MKQSKKSEEDDDVRGVWFRDHQPALAWNKLPSGTNLQTAKQSAAGTDGAFRPFIVASEDNELSEEEKSFAAE